MANPSNTVRWHQDGWIHYSFSASLAWIEAAGKQRYGAHFSLQKKDHPILYKLLIYAIGDKDNMAKHGLNPSKGLLVSGPVGCGNVEYLIM